MIAALETSSYDAIILDVEIHGELSGLSVLDYIRLTRGLDTPTLMVSSNNHWEEAFSQGADDFLEKPLKAGKLVVHLNRLLRHVEQETTIENYGPFQLDTAQQILTLDGLVIELAPEEYELAATLLRNYGKVLSFRKLMDSLSVPEERVSTKALVNRIVKLKRKMNLHKISGWQLEPVYQHGYRLICTHNDDCIS